MESPSKNVHKVKILKWGLAAAALLGATCSSGWVDIDGASAQTFQNFAGPFRTSQCAREARRAANHRVGRRPAHSRGLGSIAGGALGGFVHGTSANRWQAVYNMTYRTCINR